MHSLQIWDTTTNCLQFTYFLNLYLIFLKEMQNFVSSNPGDDLALFNHKLQKIYK